MGRRTSVVRFVFASLFILTLAAPGTTGREDNRYWAKFSAANKHERTFLANMGVAIEQTEAGSASGFVDENSLARLEKNGITPLSKTAVEFALAGFPIADAEYHDYAESLQEMKALAASQPKLISLFTIGSSIEGRQLWVMRFNTEARDNEPSQRPGTVFMGTHHAREHLSTEMPLLLAQHLASNYDKDPEVKKLLDSRDIFIIPMVNPDGVEFDINNPVSERVPYRMWRKNRRDNGTVAGMGVDLNRNYGFMWNTGGSSDDPGSEVYHGVSAFSEPETQAVRSFISSHNNLRTLLSFHTFSELILYPWGHTYDSIGDKRDLAVFETMAQTMAKWNGYKPQQSSDLYIASGDTTDWAYGERKIFAFTFELTPKSMWQGGFYPGPRVIKNTFEANLKPCLYLIEKTGNPYGVLNQAVAFKQRAIKGNAILPVRLR